MTYIPENEGFSLPPVVEPVEDAASGSDSHIDSLSLASQRTFARKYRTMEPGARSEYLKKQSDLLGFAIDEAEIKKLADEMFGKDPLVD